MNSWTDENGNKMGMRWWAPWERLPAEPTPDPNDRRRDRDPSLDRAYRAYRVCQIGGALGPIPGDQDIDPHVLLVQQDEFTVQRAKRILLNRPS